MEFERTKRLPKEPTQEEMLAGDYSHVAETPRGNLYVKYHARSSAIGLGETILKPGPVVDMAESDGAGENLAELTYHAESQTLSTHGNADLLLEHREDLRTSNLTGRISTYVQSALDALEDREV